ncbi:hypothetical protein [uncultured Shimia sp.]|uniref:hypothetical protein n=1 Tax=uncultured Shimia sp. TaxID=573152 RepID=UPI002612E7AF|nr:hypothetical protein [uncultured Shimia sp.]
MSKSSISVQNNPSLEDILADDEKVLWSGAPDFGKKLYEMAQTERVLGIGFAIGSVAMLSSLPFVSTKMGGWTIAAWVYGAVIVVFFFALFAMAFDRQFVLSNQAYFVTDRRSIVLRLGRNWRLASRIYVVSCPHAKAFTYAVRRNHPYGCLRVGTLLDKDLVQPFGFGLAQPGQPFLHGRTLVPVEFENIREADYVRSLILAAMPKERVD